LAVAVVVMLAEVAAQAEVALALGRQWYLPQVLED